MWSEPARWADWNEQLESAEIAGDLRPGAEVRMKFRRGGTVRSEITSVEPERQLVIEARFPGARVIREHSMTPVGAGVEVTHRVTITGPMSGFWALMMGRKRIRETVADLIGRERELV